MLQAIPAAEVGTDGRALEVRYGAAPGRPGLLVVTVLAHAVEGGPDHVRRSELALVVAGERMGREAMRARGEAEARRRAIARVPRVEEAWPRIQPPFHNGGGSRSFRLLRADVGHRPALGIASI